MTSVTGTPGALHPGSPSATGVADARRRNRYLPFAAPLIGEEEIAEVVDTLRSDWITTGPKVASFEAEFAAAVSAPAALALNSCTAGLHTALAVRGVGPGDEVITTPLTFAATVNVVEHVGARPVLVDVEPDTLTIDATQIAAAISSRTRAIIPVHYAGHPADMDPIEVLAGAHRLLVLEDAAHALPARYRGRLVGSGSNPAAFSFYATKNLTTAEGGMLTGGSDFIARARILSLHGMSRNAATRYQAGGHWAYEILAPGFKYNMTDIAAALGLRQLAKADQFRARREEVAVRYTAGLGDLEEIEPPRERADRRHAWHLYPIRLRLDRLAIGRDEFGQALAARGVATSVHWRPLHMQPYYAQRYGYRAEDFPVAFREWRRLISLPIFPGMSDAAVDHVIAAVRDTAADGRRRKFAVA